MLKRRVVDLTKEYELKRDDYALFTTRIATLISDVLDLTDIPHLPIESRTKTLESLKQKVELSKSPYSTLDDVTDLAGVRVITYVSHDIEKIQDSLKSLFQIHEVEETDRRLGTSQTGYQSRHLIISLSNERTRMVEFARFANMRAELQIRTLLQHAWAQTAHSHIYKQSAVLPAQITREFNMLSALLEIGDREFNRISLEIKKHKDLFNEKAEKGDLNIPIDSVTLREYLFGKLKTLPHNVNQFGPADDMAEELISEMKAYGLQNIKELDELFTPKVMEALADKDYTNFLGASRSAMTFANAEKYFNSLDTYRYAMDRANINWYKKHGLNIEPILQQHSFQIVD